QLEEIVKTSNSQSNAIAERLGKLDKEFEELSKQRTGNKKPGEGEDPGVDRTMAPSQVPPAQLEAYYQALADYAASPPAGDGAR
ncbi:hypothetical protein, partial [Mycobacterium deserti]